MLESRESGGRELEAPLLFGFLEVVCFVFLFLSPYLPSSMVQQTWHLLVLWRVATLAGLLYYQPASDPPEDSTSKRLGVALQTGFQLIGKSLLYGIPFWVSSYCFPLRIGQPDVIAKALLLYLLLTGLVLILSLLPSYWFPAFLGVASYLHFHPPPHHGAAGVLMLLPFLLLVLPRQDKTMSAGGAVRLLTVLGTSGWAICLFLDSAGRSIGLAPLSRGMLAWLLLTGAAIIVLGAAQVETQARPWAREIELSLPGLEGGLSWLYAQRLAREWGPWLVLLPLSLWGESWLWALPVALLFALPGLLGLALRGGKESHVQWWCSLQFLLFWGIAESWGSLALVWLPLAAAASFFLYRSAPKGDGFSSLCLEPGWGTSGLEGRLSLELKERAPLNLASRILEQSEPSVDFDDSLSSAAPSGFRQRLLERLRQGDSEESASSRDEPEGTP